MKEKRLHGENGQVRAILNSLPSVSAPANFEVLVRSGIAERRAREDRKPVLWLAMKFAVPMVILVSLGLFFAVDDQRAIDPGTVPPVEMLAGESRGEIPAGANNSSLEIGAGPIGNQQLDGRRKVSGIPAQVEEKALTPDNSILFPPGLDPRSSAPQRSDAPVGGTISPIAILAMLGITAECQSVGCPVVAVHGSSIAGRLGIVEGDLIEAINDTPLNNATTFSGRVDVTHLRLIRSGKKMTVAISYR